MAEWKCIFCFGYFFFDYWNKEFYFWCCGDNLWYYWLSGYWSEVLEYECIIWKVGGWMYMWVWIGLKWSVVGE